MHFGAIFLERIYSIRDTHEDNFKAFIVKNIEEIFTQKLRVTIENEFHFLDIDYAFFYILFSQLACNFESSEILFL